MGQDDRFHCVGEPLVIVPPARIEMLLISLADPVDEFEMPSDGDDMSAARKRK
jgi:hypothetical protein